MTVIPSGCGGRTSQRITRTDTTPRTTAGSYGLSDEIENDSTMIVIYDTTLRDGAQTFGISFSLHDKIRIAREIDRLKIDYIEGGWPGSNRRTTFFFGDTEIGHRSCQDRRVRLHTTSPHEGERRPLPPGACGLGRRHHHHRGQELGLPRYGGARITLRENLELITDKRRAISRTGDSRCCLDAEHFTTATGEIPISRCRRL